MPAPGTRGNIPGIINTVAASFKRREKISLTIATAQAPQKAAMALEEPDSREI